MIGSDSRPKDIKERTFAFSLEIVRLCRTLDRKPGTSRTLGQQFLRSGTSIGANVEEAQAGQSQPDFISKYNIALKEAREAIFWLRLLDASEECPDGVCRVLSQEAGEITRIIASIIVNTRKNSKNK